MGKRLCGFDICYCSCKYSKCYDGTCKTPDCKECAGHAESRKNYRKAYPEHYEQYKKDQKRLAQYEAYGNES